MDPHPAKRARHSPTTKDSPTDEMESAEISLGNSGGKASTSSSFRNVSACNRCRLRKNRCDQRLPSCASCAKAGVRCVGYDPITKREIPRSYVFYLETRVQYLERVLQENNVEFDPPEVLEHSSRPGPDTTSIQTTGDDAVPNGFVAHTSQKASPQEAAWSRKQDESEKLNTLVSNIGSVSVQGASDSRYLGSTSGISFARVVFAAVKSSVSGANSERGGVRPSKLPQKTPGGTTMRDSFFGLHTKPTIKQAPFPDQDVGLRLVQFYFEHANPQIPILHRGEFMRMFEMAYAEGDERVRTPRELYMLNIVFAIGAGIFLGDESKEGEKKKKNLAGQQSQPEEYHASAIVHLESCLSSPSSIDRADGFGGGLQELQAVLLLAGFALLRPVAPGLWYIIGVAVRLAIDLGLHFEDVKDHDVGLDEVSKHDDSDAARLHHERSMKEKGRREWVRDFRRRLWWCTYSFDRLVSTCVGRPFGITDQVITTEFPSLLDDKYITPTGFLVPSSVDEPSYKNAAYHYFRLRLLQSEILQVLQHQHAQVARASGANTQNPYMHTTLPSPFLSGFDSFRSWRMDIDKRLWEWKVSAPTKAQTGVDFSVEFLELNYWQCVIMLYRQSLSVPPLFEGEYSTTEEVQSPNMLNVELREDEERVFLKVAEAGQRVLRIYRQLHRVHLVNYTFLATHHLFMAGISFLYAIWHSPIVRSRLTMDEVDFTVLAATSVLGDLIEKCPPAEACRDAFDRMSKATVQMCMSTTGFSSAPNTLSSRNHAPPAHHKHSTESGRQDYFQPNRGSASRKPIFDVGFNDLLAPVRSPRTYTVPQHANNDSNANQREMKIEIGATSQMSPQVLPSPSDYDSPPLSRLDPGNVAIDPSLLPSYSPMPPHSTFPNTTSPRTSTTQQHQQQHNTFQHPYQELPFPPLDPDWDMAAATGDMADFDIPDLGMGGMGWEWELGGGGDHGLGEGGGVPDLFEGFFFGGAGGY